MYEGGGSIDCVEDGEVVVCVGGVWGEKEGCGRGGGWASRSGAEVKRVWGRVGVGCSVMR